MELSTTLPLAGGITGAVGVALAVNEPSDALVDKIVRPVGGFIAGAQVGAIASDLASDMELKTKLISAGARVLVLGAGVLGFSLWRSNSKHSDAGAVGIGFVSMVVADVAIGVVDNLTAKMLPERKL